MLGSIRAGPLKVSVPPKRKAEAAKPAAHALTRFRRLPSPGDHSLALATILQVRRGGLPFGSPMPGFSPSSCKPFLPARPAKPCLGTLQGLGGTYLALGTLTCPRTQLNPGDPVQTCIRTLPCPETLPCQEFLDSPA